MLRFVFNWFWWPSKWPITLQNAAQLTYLLPVVASTSSHHFPFNLYTVCTSVFWIFWSSLPVLCGVGLGLVFLVCCSHLFSALQTWCVPHPSVFFNRLLVPLGLWTLLGCWILFDHIIFYILFVNFLVSCELSLAVSSFAFWGRKCNPLRGPLCSCFSLVDERHICWPLLLHTFHAIPLLLRCVFWLQISF